MAAKCLPFHVLHDLVGAHQINVHLGSIADYADDCGVLALAQMVGKANFLQAVQQLLHFFLFRVWF